MKKILLVVFCVVLLFGCGQTARGLKQNIAFELQPSALRQSFGVQPQNLQEKSKCDKDFSVNVVNTETNNRDINIVPSAVFSASWLINPQELSGQIVDYVKDAYKQSRVPVSPTSKKIINISIKKIEVASSFTSAAVLELNITLPEKQTTEKFSSLQSTGDVHRAVIYTIHDISWQIVNDPVIQDYLLCR
jgi:hypothetical protein